MESFTTTPTIGAMPFMSAPSICRHLLFTTILVLPASSLAADGAIAPRELDVRIDQAIYRTINIGAPLYNQGDPAGCYRLYQGALFVIEPLLGHRSELQQQVARALQDVELVPSYAQRATDLRRMLDRVLSAVRTSPVPVPVPLPPQSQTRTQTPPIALWTRLGGESAVKAVVHDFVTLAAGDPQVDFTRGGRYPLDAVAIARLEKLLVDFISAVSGGPLKYEGRPMKPVHQGMAITDAQFDALAGDLAVVLKKNNVSAREADELLAIVASTRRDIVETGRRPQGR